MSVSDARVQDVVSLMQNNPDIIPSVLQYTRSIAAKQRLQVHVNKMSGEEVLALQMKDTETVKSLKAKVRAGTNLGVGEVFDLVYIGAVLRDDSRTLRNLEVVDGSVVNMVVKKYPPRQNDHRQRISYSYKNSASFSQTPTEMLPGNWQKCGVPWPRLKSSHILTRQTH